MTGIKAIVFDLDDTLIDNRMLDYESFRYLGSTLGLYVPTMHQIMELRRRSALAEDIISWMIKKSEKSVSQTLCMKKRKEFLRREGSGPLVRKKPEVRSALNSLKSRGCLLLVATFRNDKKAVLDLLQAQKIAAFFDGVYVRQSRVLDDRTRISEPDAEKAKFKIYNKILCELQVLPGECLVVGNMLEDLLPALSLGMKAVGTRGSYGIDPTLRCNVEVVEDLSDLIKML